MMSEATTTTRSNTASDDVEQRGARGKPPTPGISTAIAPQLTDHRFSVGGLAADLVAGATIRDQLVAPAALAYLVAPPSEIQAFAMRANGEIPLPQGREVSRLAADGARTPLVTIDAAAVDGDGAIPTVGIADAPVTCPFTTFAVAWEAIEAAIRVLLTHGGAPLPDAFDPEQFVLFDLGVDGSILIRTRSPGTDPLAFETPPEAIAGAVYLTPTVLAHGIDERHAEAAPSVDKFTGAATALEVLLVDDTADEDTTEATHE